MGFGEIVKPLLPPQVEHPQGSDTRYVDSWSMPTAVVNVLIAGWAYEATRGLSRRSQRDGGLRLSGSVEVQRLPTSRRGEERTLVHLFLATSRVLSR